MRDAQAIRQPRLNPERVLAVSAILGVHLLALAAAPALTISAAVAGEGLADPATSRLVVLVPGTGVIYTVSTGLVHGRRASFYASVGCTLGIVPHLAVTDR